MIGSVIRLSLIIAGWYFVLPVIAHSAVCDVTFGFANPDQGPVSGVLVDIGYAGAGTHPVGGADRVECTGLIPGAMATFNHVSSSDLVKAGVVRLEAFSGNELFRCTFEGETPSTESFAVETFDATAPNLQSIVPPPPVAVSDIVCDGPVGSDGNGSPAGDPPAPDTMGCDVTFHVESSKPIGGLSFEVDYADSAAHFAGSGSGVECATLVPSALGAYNDDETSSTLLAALVHVGGFEGVSDVVRCHVAADSAAAASGYAVSVVDAIDPDGVSILPVPTVEVGHVSCGDGSGSDGSQGSDTPAGDASDPSDCDGPYEVTFGVEADGTIAALQFAVEYTTAPGGFSGEAEAVSCTAIGGAAGAFASFNDQDSLFSLNAAFVSLAGIPGTTEVLRCRFDAVGGGPTADDFSVVDIDASRKDLSKVTPKPWIGVVSIKPAADNSGCAPVPECGNGKVEGDEQCDDGNSGDGDACRNDCREAVCGDGVVRGGHEDCDQGEGNSNVLPDTCRTNCTRPVCGDGVADSGEECDDGNDNDEDSCLTGCVEARCGDGFVLAEAEACDDGEINNDADPEACRTTCELPEICGDADHNGRITATDAMRILNNAIGLVNDCTRSRCDVNASTSLTATDARAVLNVAVGIATELDCWLPVVFRLENDVAVGALQFVVDYSETGSTFVGSGDGVYCTSLAADDVLATFNNDVDTRLLHVAIVSSNGFSAPAAVAACSFYQNSTDLVPEDFVIDVIDAVKTDSSQIDEPEITTTF